MTLANAYVLPTNRITDLFSRIRDGQAPQRFTIQLLRDWGFASTNDRAFIPLLKALGFLTPDGNPTQRYHSYRDHSRSKAVMGEALKEAYGDLFLIRENLGQSDREAIEGKFKSFHNVSENVAGLMSKTFFALLSLADTSQAGERRLEQSTITDENSSSANINSPVTEHIKFHYNIQIHLPSTKDVEVFNAIFKSLKEHLID